MTQLVCLSNLENLNALFIGEGLSHKERLERLNKIAIHQMTILSKDVRRGLAGGEKKDAISVGIYNKLDRIGNARLNMSQTAREQVR